MRETTTRAIKVQVLIRHIWERINQCSCYRIIDGMGGVYSYSLIFVIKLSFNFRLLVFISASLFYLMRQYSEIKLLCFGATVKKKTKVHQTCFFLL